MTRASETARERKRERERERIAKGSLREFWDRKHMTARAENACGRKNKGDMSNLLVYNVLLCLTKCLFDSNKFFNCAPLELLAGDFLLNLSSNIGFSVLSLPLFCWIDTILLSSHKIRQMQYVVSSADN
ncbi:uncharacterized protein LOC122498810 [Leptopilina heterotoma]|uniref:uncharacterized protein LOC122498810 n=1 Tax=Leptopilina heterotoma TaxID=63436 RepID=UPI001CA84DC2|nr:uncharacterized protein LOC122498810 [Leptopilina heterotoma]